MRLQDLFAASAFLLLLPICAARADGPVVWLDSLPLDNMTQDFGEPQARATVDHHPLTLGSRIYTHGVGTHANSTFHLSLGGKAQRFEATVGVDDETNKRGSVTFRVVVDGKVAAQTGVLHGGDAPQRLSVSLAGAKDLTLLVGETNGSLSFDHADWADAAITLADGAASLPAIPMHPRTLDAAPRIRFVPDSAVPAIHGARRVGATPGRPFLFLIPATGQGPLRYTAKNLPPGLALDPATGIISGTLHTAGTTPVLLTVRGPAGTAWRVLSIVGGTGKLALTPPMGWNSWNVWGTSVDDTKVRAAADVMLSSGLARHGFQYVNIDDGWQGGRDAQGRIQANRKFPDLQATASYVHSRGLKFGIYSSPGPQTCGGFTGSYGHEAQDAASYAAWGVDYLKYDWCSYDTVVQGDHSLPALQKPYAAMRQSLDGTGRDIVYSLCQYGWGDVWKWGAGSAVGGSSWRTTDDIQDNWGSLHAIYESQAGHEKYAGPGHWNDPDMLMVGVVGFGNTHPTHLRPNEQILHLSLWCLLSSPILIGCDMTKLDPFTQALLSNDEALDINQDPLGRPARLVSSRLDIGEVWARPLFDGTQAVGLVNPNPWASAITVQWSDLGLKGPQPVRDLWLHRQAGSPSHQYSVEVPAHGCVLLKIGRPAAAR